MINDTDVVLKSFRCRMSLMIERIEGWSNFEPISYTRSTCSMKRASLSSSRTTYFKAQTCFVF